MSTPPRAGPSERISAQPVCTSATAPAARLRGTSTKTTVWRSGRSIAWATPPRKVNTKSGQRAVEPLRSARPRAALMAKSQPLTAYIRVGRATRSMITPATVARPSVATERTRFRLPSSAPELVTS
jgi:hypothetical protein